MATTETDVRTLTVRNIVPEDAGTVAELSGELGYQTSANEMAERIRSITPPRDGHIVLAACFGDEVVGWIEAEIVRHLQSQPHTLITGLVVKDGLRSLGVGKRLCYEVEHWSRSRGVFVIRVTSRSTRERAHHFYLREGFALTKTSLVFEKVLS